MQFLPNTCRATHGGFLGRVHAVKIGRMQGIMHDAGAFPDRGRAMRAARKLAEKLKAEGWRY